MMSRRLANAPPTVACSPRPPVRVSTVVSGGKLQVTIAATGQNNTPSAPQFSRTDNALVDVGGQSGRSGAFTVSPPGAPASTTFAVRRMSAGPVTVAFAVVDGCGSWTTFVGGGAGAF